MLGNFLFNLIKPCFRINSFRQLRVRLLQGSRNLCRYPSCDKAWRFFNTIFRVVYASVIKDKNCNTFILPKSSLLYTKFTKFAHCAILISTVYFTWINKVKCIYIQLHLVYIRCYNIIIVIDFDANRAVSLKFCSSWIWRVLFSSSSSLPWHFWKQILLQGLKNLKTRVNL